MEKDILICQCHNTEHQVLFHYDTEDKYVYIQVHLNTLSFFKRFEYAVKYLFGFKSRYGAFSEFIVHQDDAEKFEKVYLTLKKNDYHVW